MHLNTRVRKVLAAGMATCVVALAAGCASRAAAPHGEPDLLTAEQLAGYRHQNAYDAIRQLRPQWLRSARGQSSIVESTSSQRGLRVYVDGILFGRAPDLRSLEVRAIREVRFLDAPKATLQYGTNHAEGALVITTAG